jgi:hypothetical protein
MGRPPLFDRKLTPAERQSRYRQEQAAQMAKLRTAMERIIETRTLALAKAIAAEALAD